MIYDLNVVIVDLRRTDSVVSLDGGCLFGLDVEADNRFGVGQADIVLVKRNNPDISIWKRIKTSACFGEIKVADCRSCSFSLFKHSNRLADTDYSFPFYQLVAQRESLLGLAWSLRVPCHPQVRLYLGNV